MFELEQLEGRWHLSRDIEDRLNNRKGRLVGSSVWEPDAQGLRQTESGLLKLDGAPAMKAERVYLWRRTGRGLAVFFDDGRPFHEITDHGAEVRHLCIHDLYVGSYSFVNNSEFRSGWRVSGPRKDYSIANTFTREALPVGKEAARIAPVS